MLITAVFLAKESPANAPAGIAPRVPFFKGFLTQSLKLDLGTSMSQLWCTF
jgi:hypothetical protein